MEILLDKRAGVNEHITSIYTHFSLVKFLVKYAKKLQGENCLLNGITMTNAIPLMILGHTCRASRLSRDFLSSYALPWIKSN